MDQAVAPTGGLRRRRAMIAGGLIAVAILLGVMLAWASRGQFSGRYALPNAGAKPVFVPPTTLPPPVGKAVPPTALPAPVARPLPPPPVPVATAPVSEDTQAIGDAVARATVKALRRGETVRWHKRGQSGYITVSEARDDGSRLCRNVSATVIDGAAQVQSSAHLWCQTDDADWAPAG